MQLEQIRKITGLIGLGIPFLIFLGFTYFFLILNPVALENIHQLTIASFNIEGVPGQKWVSNFVYKFIGFSIIVFSIGLFIITSKKSSVDKLAIIFLFISGFFWSILGFNKFNPTGNNDFSFAIMIVSTITTLGFGILSFFLLAFGDTFIKEKKIYRILLISIGLFVICESLIRLFISNYPQILGYTSWFVFFLGYAVIGINLIARKTMQIEDSILDNDMT